MSDYIHSATLEPLRVGFKVEYPGSVHRRSQIVANANLTDIYDNAPFIIQPGPGSGISDYMLPIRVAFAPLDPNSAGTGPDTNYKNIGGVLVTLRFRRVVNDVVDPFIGTE